MTKILVSADTAYAEVHIGGQVDIAASADGDAGAHLGNIAAYASSSSATANIDITGNLNVYAHSVNGEADASMTAIHANAINGDAVANINLANVSIFARSQGGAANAGLDYLVAQAASDASANIIAANVSITAHAR
ncbi:hypothetical protein G6677_09285, partial [Polynucleobacter paneuropaeus]|nr:hypothetical protein [Polynucleobacter paneuropaeus]